MGLLALIAVFLLSSIVRAFLLQPFHIPSSAQEPTLIEGDYLFAVKSDYGYSASSFPFGIVPISGRIFGAEPARGDVVIFKSPADGRTDYVKRVVGLPGDRVQMRDGVLFINDEAVPKVRFDDFIEYFGEIAHAVPQYRETLPTGASYPVLDRTPNGDLDNTDVFMVPEGHYFTLGDNRDNSDDSRASKGFVPFENLVGRAAAIFYSSEGNSPIWQFWNWIPETRFERIGTAIR